MTSGVDEVSLAVKQGEKVEEHLEVEMMVDQNLMELEGLAVPLAVAALVGGVKA